MLNAVSNAEKHTTKGPGAVIGVTAWTRETAVSGGGAGAATAPRELVIEVTDAGPGLRGQTLAQLTTEFGGGGTDPTRYGIRSSGTGISICVM